MVDFFTDMNESDNMVDIIKVDSPVEFCEKYNIECTRWKWGEFDEIYFGMLKRLKELGKENKLTGSFNEMIEPDGGSIQYVSKLKK